jgi:hypothetical protein
MVMCPNWKNEKHVNNPQGWSLSQKDLVQVGNNFFAPSIECIVCHDKFSLQQGVKEAFLSDIPFVINDFQYNAREDGKVEVVVGQLKTIEFATPFEDIPKIYLTPYLKPVACVPGAITNSKLTIFSCASDSGVQGETREINWAAYGNRNYGAIPIWRKLISSSKEHQLRKDFKPELVDLESAFEVFVGEYLGKNLRSKLRRETVDWMLKRSIEEQLKIGFIELTGKSLSELQPVAYEKWQIHVKELRDSVVHRGAFVSDEQAIAGREAVFDLLTRIDPTAINYFQISLEKIREEHPNFTFGTAVIKGAK